MRGATSKEIRRYVVGWVQPASVVSAIKMIKKQWVKTPHKERSTDSTTLLRMLTAQINGNPLKMRSAKRPTAHRSLK